MKLNCTTRTILGKGVKKLRAQGLIPAELFGSEIENTHITLNSKDFQKIYKETGMHGIIELVVDNNSPINVLVSEVTHDPYGKLPLTVGFHAIKMNEKVRTYIPIHYQGTSPMEKSGFTILKLIDEIEIEALPHNVPEAITVPLETLDTESSKIHVKELNVPKNVKIIHADPEQIVAVVSEKRKQEPKEEEITEIPEGEPQIQEATPKE